MKNITLDRLDLLREGLLQKSLPMGTVRYEAQDGFSNNSRFTDANTGEELEDVIGFEIHPVRDESNRALLIRYAGLDDHDNMGRVVVEMWLCITEGA